jgi:hypothetical protein
MVLELDEEKVQILVELVSSRIAELHPTIRRCRVSTATEELKHDLVVLQELQQQLADAVSQPQA